MAGDYDFGNEAEANREAQERLFAKFKLEVEKVASSNKSYGTKAAAGSKLEIVPAADGEEGSMLVTFKERNSAKPTIILKFHVNMKRANNELAISSFSDGSEIQEFPLSKEDEAMTLARKYVENYQF